MDHNHFNDGGVAINFAELARSTHASESAIRQSVDRLVRHGVLIERRGAFGDEPTYVPNSLFQPPRGTCA
jgi:hypothetical protein